ncbi:prolipoprotein diacylglyceryl transferase [Methylobacterium tardum]|uniref:prolipoprotein diacylglyceryl transferase n=1 Tax=Methylobacterium tardum TaxID=374432 RepID=UPI0020201A9B|nr:prolipoprotein diacylglyceryl transferase [Methylobacterium tardum]URD36734.1 prolipoprotein diacylglyceryl transferase [Methylobacterium tardum]
MMPLLALPFPAIDPVALAIGPITIKWYALAYIAGLIGGWYYARRLVMADRLWGVVKRPQVADIDDLVVWVALGVVLGGRIGYVLFYNLPMYLADPIEILAIRNGGMSFHGGFLGAILAFLLFARAKKLNGYTLLDIGAVVVPIGLFFGRIANFVNGELWGRVAPDFPYAIVFPSGGPLPRHPSQLYEAATEGLLLFIVMAIAVRRFGFRKPGLLGGIFVLGYALARTFCEFFREPDRQLGFLFGDHLGPMGGGVTMGMLLCVPMMIVGLTYIVLAATGRTRPRHPVEGPVAAEEARKAPVEA